MRRRLDLAASLIAAPPVLFLDEPTTGLDPAGRLALWQLLGQLTGEGASLLLTTQYIEEAERLAATIVIINRGHVIARGTPDELRTQAGGDRLDLQAPPGQDPRRLAAAVAALAAGEPAVDEATGRVVLPVADGAAVLPAVARRLADADLNVSALALRRPTLEEAFLALTGHLTGNSQPDARSAKRVPAGPPHPAGNERSTS
jgi:ABC-type multidrug transport system ATPase subunit